MSSRAALICGLVLGGPVGCATAATSWAPAAPMLEEPEAPRSLPFRRDPQGRVILDGAVSGRPASVHLDSGAVGTIVSPALIDPATARRADTAVLNDSIRVTRWRGVRIDIGPLTVEPELVVSAERPGRSDVLIGNRVFEQAVVEIDYEAEAVLFHEPTTFAPPPDATPLPLSRDGERITAQLSLNGQAPVCVGVDTGFNGALSLTPTVVQSHGLAPDPTIQVIHETVGREPLRVFGLQRVERVTIAGVDLANVAASPGGYRDTRCGSLLGTELLSGFHLYFDLSRDVLWLKPRKDLAPRFETVMGITYRQTPNGMLVTAISAASPAMGLVRIGERIARVEQTPLAFIMSDGEVRRPPQSGAPTAPPEGEHLGDGSAQISEE